MTVELVTGHAGVGHIDGFDVGGLIGGIAGDGDYVLQEPYGTIDCTVKDNNHVIIGKGDLIMSGRHVRIEDPETLTVQSGTQGQQRHDLVVMRYSRQSSGVETAELRVLRGMPGASGTPWYDTGSILNGSTTREMPLYRLDLNGISLSTAPARLFNTLTPLSAIMPNVDKQMSNVTNMINQEIDTIYTRKLVSDNDFNLSGVVVNGMAIITIRWTNLRGFHIGEWGTHAIGEITNGWKCDFEIGNWSIDNSDFNDCWFSLNGNHIDFRSRSAHDIAAGTWHLCTITAPVHK